VGYEFSPPDQGADDTIDSDPDPTTGQTATTTLVSGENDLSWDAGIFQRASLGDYVWEDTNADGIQDGTETGINGVTVTLFDGQPGCSRRRRRP
jgi:serine-aspartate repeat-containing protein C/D/E